MATVEGGVALIKLRCWRLPVVVLFISLIASQSQLAYAQTSPAQMEKPRVAVKMPDIGEGVPRSVLKHLTLSTVLAEMESALHAVRKFDVLTRQKDKLKSLREEQKFAKSPLSKGNAAKEGQLEAANYIVFPTVQDFKFYRSSTPVPNISNKYVRRDSGILQIHAQVLDTESGQIKANFYLKSTFATKDQVVNTKGGHPSSTYFTRMAKDVAAQMADQLIDSVFPMLVLNAEGDLVWINRGADGGLKKGYVLNVYRPGKQLIDPYTKEVLGTAEQLIGRVKVVRVNPKFTVAEIVRKGLKEPPQNGDILRKP